MSVVDSVAPRSALTPKPRHAAGSNGCAGSAMRSAAVALPMSSMVTASVGSSSSAAARASVSFAAAPCGPSTAPAWRPRNASVPDAAAAEIARLPPAMTCDVAHAAERGEPTEVDVVRNADLQAANRGEAEALPRRGVVEVRRVRRRPR